MSHSIKPGVATGHEVQEIFKLAKEKGFDLKDVSKGNKPGKTSSIKRVINKSATSR